MRIGFIGMGNMGYAMLKGLSQKEKYNIVFTELDIKKSYSISKETGCESVEIEKLCKYSKYIVLAIKSNQYKKVLEEISTIIDEETVLISITPSFDIKTIRGWCNNHRKIVRSMPNTPALVGCGMSAICCEEEIFTENEKLEIENIFKSFGDFEYVSEFQMDAVTCISGSLPAYVDIFIETLSDVGVKYGLPRDKAYKFAAKAVEGSSKLILDTKEHPAVLKDRVCSPSGTTIEALEALEKNGFRKAVWEAGNACYNKIKKMN